MELLFFNIYLLKEIGKYESSVYITLSKQNKYIKIIITIIFIALLE